jgi:Asp-tRNA(Asn)/Glu-tRNA(Gln) amidotransferase A subunit family amidase
VAVGAGIVDFAVAGDYGGSVRWPAQAAGVFGLRLGTAHRLAGAAATGRAGLRPPRGGQASLQWELETAGLMARSPAVLRAVLAALAGAARARPPEKRLLVTDGTEIAERAGAPPVPAALSRLRGRAADIRRAVREALSPSGAAALLLPLAAGGPTGFDGQTEVAGRAAEATELMAHCRAVSLTGLRALSAPVRPGPTGPSPARSWLSVQLAGPDLAEDQLCAVAADLAGA